MTIKELKSQSGAKYFASVMGKSTINSRSEEYKMIEDAVVELMKRDFGIIHGGYAGGAMSAASEAAANYLQENSLPTQRNIGVPQKEHEGLWDRARGAVFTNVADNLFSRLHMITSGDIAVFAPLGGDGTEVEESIIFHENIIRGYTNEKPVSMIFLQTANGVKWRELISRKIELLDTNIESIEDLEWLHFVNSVEEFKNLLSELDLT